ncbi:HbrB-domain-containing protein [Rickenella mellea]|uniref:HbrB-domain-containing protein n=1 Tax=Rickenella mellea TaxID=50990 RepID=A0A4Y7QG95_9AGAM|nr:HbrB-domain-containing protein [Rickenella mellea]
MSARPPLVSPSQDTTPTNRREHRRSSSDATPSQSHFHHRPPNPKEVFDAVHTKLFGDKSAGSSSSQTLSAASTSTARSGTPIPASLLPPRKDSRSDSPQLAPAASVASVAASHLTAMASPPSTSKLHTSPSKAVVSTGRTYDAKLVTREMHRLGTLAHLPGIVAPSLAAAASSTSLALPSAPAIAASSSGDSAWAQLHVHVLPLFNGDPLRIPIEDLNTLVRRHIELVMSSGPSRAVSTLENDASELINSGMITLNAKLAGVEDEKLLGRVVEKWGFFWDQVLPYVEGVFLPLQTDPLLLSLYRTPKSHRPTSPSLRDGVGSTYMSSPTTQTGTPVDVRTLALRAFRDKIIYPMSSRLESRLLMIRKREGGESSGYQQPRLRQMLLVLLSQAHRQQSLSLTAPSPSPSPPELAIRTLLDIVQSLHHAPLVPSASAKHFGAGSGSAPTFLTGGVPRDRRGRIATKPKKATRFRRLGGSLDIGEEDAEDDDGGETPRNGFSPAGSRGRKDADREQEFLDALRSPDMDATMENASQSQVPRAGGWGLGAGREEKPADDDDEEGMDWDQAQAYLEGMVGFGGSWMR